jgi:hypothetical protein
MKVQKEQGLFIIGATTIVIFSFFNYAACFFGDFNSDQAIHVLMSHHFTWPRDAYFWGQNRLGSLLPLITHLFLKVIPVHPLYMISIVQWLLLLTPALIISGLLKNLWLKLCVFIMIFLPISENYYLLLIGHPYAAQLFCLSLYLLFFKKFVDLFFLSPQWGRNEKLSLWYLVLAEIFLFLGIWVSDLSLLFLLTPVFYIFLNRKSYTLQDSKTKVIALAIEILLFLLLAQKIIEGFKKYGQADAFYNKMFISTPEEISAQFRYLFIRLSETFLFLDDRIIENLFFYFVILSTILIIMLCRNKHSNSARWINPLLLTGLIGFIVLFFSSWNFRSEYSSKYYIPVYLSIGSGLLILIDSRISKIAGFYFFAAYGFLSLYSVYLSVIQYHRLKPLEKFGEFASLPNGTIISGYWDTHMINAICPYNLNAIPFQDQPIRNWKWKDAILDTTQHFYFLNTSDFQFAGKDTIVQFERQFIYTGKKYLCNGIEVLDFSQIKNYPAK